MWTLPNILTAARIAAAPGLLAAFAVLPRPLADWTVLVLFIAAALTDYLDGWIARRFDKISALGAMLDPIADKAMVLCALAVLMAVFGPEPWLALPVGIIVVREVLVSGLREYLGEIKLPVTAAAKAKTTVQLIAIALLLVPVRLFDGLLFGLGVAGLWLAAILTAQTGWAYFQQGLAHIAKQEAK
ncbi:MAG: CDP-diacylglycerol--glycerol-3-phosphate 3-phosphatidyltransferase [Pseudomonadota bacterium]